jgi:hypothetical protein
MKALIRLGKIVNPIKLLKLKTLAKTFGASNKISWQKTRLLFRRMMMTKGMRRKKLKIN